jgi:hypothetical protein
MVMNIFDTDDKGMSYTQAVEYCKKHRKPVHTIFGDTEEITLEWREDPGYEPGFVAEYTTLSENLPGEEFGMSGDVFWDDEILENFPILETCTFWLGAGRSISYPD